MLKLNIPKNIKLLYSENWIQIEGPLGIIKKKKSPFIKLNFNLETNILSIENFNKKNHFFLSILNKLIWGVSKGFYMKLNIVGVGFKAAIIDTNLQLKIGFSHIVNYKIPEGIKISISSQKALTLIIFGNDLQKVTQTAAEIRNLKPVEPYKGKGIKYSKEVVKKKEGKKTNV